MEQVIEKYWLTSHTLAGVVHFVSAIIGLLLGLGILFLKPGTKTHKTAGYIFIPVLITVNVTALFIHEMGVRFGPFHYLIPISLFFLFLGIKPFFSKKRGKKQLKMHIRGMVGAALGLWAAFFAEFFARTPALSQYLSKLGNNSFWISTLEGFFFVFLFIFVIIKVINSQYKRLGLK